MRKLTHEEFMEKFNKQNKHAQDIQILGTYVNYSTKIKCRCKIHEHIWEATPNNLLKGQNCPKCGKEASTQKMTRTHEEFMKKFYEKNENANNIEILGTYVKNKTKIKCRCKIDGHIWEVKPNSLLRGIGCPICGTNRTAQKRTKTQEQFLQELEQKNKHAKDIQILGKYININTPIKCKCKIDGHEWEVTPNSLLGQQSGCPICGAKMAGEKNTKTQEQFLQELYEVNPNIEVLETYKTSSTKIKCKCKIDGYEWEVIPSSLLRGVGCPKCNTSKGEKRVAQYLDNLSIDYIYNKGYFNNLVGTGGGLLKPDFIIPSLKIWIEYDGIQHYEPTDFTGKLSEKQVQEQFKKVQQNDQIKNQYAKDNNWTLIRIPYWDIDNIEQILDAVLKQEQAI